MLPIESDEELLRTIEHGVVFSPMHSWRGQLTDGEMQDVVSYVRLLSQQGGNRILKTREAYLVKRCSIPDSDVSRFTFHERRTERTAF